MSGFKFTAKFGAACDRIIKHPNTDEGQRSFVKSVKKTSSETGYVSESQASWVGKIYKNTVNGGRYVKHDWWS